MKKLLVSLLSLLLSLALVMPISADDETTYVAKIGEEQYETLQAAVDAATDGQIIELLSTVELDSVLSITNKTNITIKGTSDLKIKGSDNFVGEDSNANLINVSNSTVNFDGTVIEAGSNNRNVLSINSNSNVTLKGVILNHENGKVGAPLIINESKVTLTGSLTLTTGNNSWYAMNVDARDGESSFDAGTNNPILLRGDKTKFIFKIDIDENTEVNDQMLKLTSGIESESNPYKVVVNELPDGTTVDDLVDKGGKDFEIEVENQETPETTYESIVEFEKLGDTYTVGDTVDFSVTTKLAKDETIPFNVKGKAIVKGDGLATVQYKEYDGKWYPLTGDFGPANGFPFSNATSEFKATFEKPGTLEITIQIVNANNPEEIVCSTQKTITIVEDNDKPNYNWVYRPSVDKEDEEVKEYTTAEKSKACVELLGKGWAYSEKNKSCVYTLDSNTQQIPNTSTR